MTFFANQGVYKLVQNSKTWYFKMQNQLINTVGELLKTAFNAWKKQDNVTLDNVISGFTEYQVAKLGKLLTENITIKANRLAQLLDKHTLNQQLTIIGNLKSMSVLIEFGNYLLKKVPNFLFKPDVLILRPRLIQKLRDFDFGEHFTRAVRPLAVLMVNISKFDFSLEERLSLKPMILRALSMSSDSRVSYWYIMCLHRIVKEENISILEMEQNKLFRILVDNMESNLPRTLVRFTMKVVTIFAYRYGAECIANFYREELMENTIMPWIKSAPILTYIFLEKLHGENFSTGFPDYLTNQMLSLVMEFDPWKQQQQKCLEYVIRISRYRLVDLVNVGKLRQIDISTPMEDGLIDKMCLILHHDFQLSLKQQVYRFIKDLLIVVSKGMKELLFVIINVMINEGMLERARDDQNNIDLRYRASAVYQMLDATDEFWNVWESLNLFEQFP